MNPQLFAGNVESPALFAIAARTSTTNGSAVDLNPYDGNICLLFATAAPSGTDTPTLTFTLEHSDTGSGSWSAVSGVSVAFTAAGKTHAVVNSDSLKRYVRAVATISGTNPSFTCLAYALALPNPA